MVLFLLVLQAVFVLGVVLFTISFLIASLTEKEPRAALITAAVILFLIGFELGIYGLYSLGFFFNTAGRLLLLAGWAVMGFGIYFFGRHTGPNDKALKGVEGYIVGNARRFDEREQVFARERSIRPGSAEYETFYRSHPELEQLDAERRAAGGILGTPGAIDRPGEIAKRLGHGQQPFPSRPISGNPKTTARQFSCPRQIVPTLARKKLPDGSRVLPGN